MSAATPARAVYRAGYRARRRLPPYGRELVDTLAHPATWGRYAGTSPDGRHLTLGVVAGAAAWDCARGLRGAQWLVLMAPPDDPPDSYSWGLLMGHDPVLLHIAGALDVDALHALIGALMRDGVERVLTLHPERPGERYIVGKAA